MEGRRVTNLLKQYILACLIEKERPDNRPAKLINGGQSDQPPVANQFIRIHLFEQVVGLCKLIEQLHGDTPSTELRSRRI